MTYTLTDNSQMLAPEDWPTEDRAHRRAIGHHDRRPAVSYLSRAEVDLFDQQLAKIPDLLTELAESITGRAGYGSGRRTPPKSRPPVNLDAQDLYDRCNAVLVAIAHDISEQRGIPIEPIERAADVVRWLHTHRFALQLIEFGNDPLTDACWIVTTIERALGIAGHAPLGHTERGQAEDARVTLSTIEAVAGAAGEYGLTRNRLRKLIERKYVRPLTTAVDGTKLYRFGDVLAAHRDTRTETR